MKFPKSKVATEYLSHLKGVEIGGSAHNAFGLNTINVDNSKEITVYKKEELKQCGEMLPVDVVADAGSLPFADKSYDFVISSHMLEHAYDPFSVIAEWVRVAKKYILIIIPRKDKTFDKDKGVTPTEYLEGRMGLKPLGEVADDHWCIWDVNEFMKFCLTVGEKYGMMIEEFQSVDDKVGNGMLVLFRLK